MSKMSEQKPIVIVSGGFDPIHIGHLRMIQEAAMIGEVIVILNNDNWLKTKKGFAFMPEDEREEILQGIKGVEFVFKTSHEIDDKDKSVVKDLKEIKEVFGSNRMLIFANGGDRVTTNTLEIDYCLKNDIKLLFNVGGGKIQSSSELVKNVRID